MKFLRHFKNTYFLVNIDVICEKEQFHKHSTDEENFFFVANVLYMMYFKEKKHILFKKIFSPL